MKRLFVIVVMMLISSVAYGQERYVNLAEDVEVQWATGLDADQNILWGDWQALPVDSAVFSEGTPPTTQILSGLLGPQRFIAPIVGVTPATICTVDFTLNSITPVFWWGNYMRVRWCFRATVDEQEIITGWSPESDAKAIVNLAPPGKPIW